MRLDNLILVNHLLSYEDLTPKILLDTLEQAVEQFTSEPLAKTVSATLEDIRFNPLFQILVKCLIKHDSMNLYLQTINNSSLSKLEKIYDILLEIFISSKKNTVSSTINTDSEILLDIVDSIKALHDPEKDSSILDFCDLANVQARSLSKYLYNIIIAKYPPSIPRLRFVIHTSSSFNCLISAKYLALALSLFFNPQRITFSLKTDNFLNNQLPLEDFPAKVQCWTANDWPYSYEKNWNPENFGKYLDDSNDLNILSKRCIKGLRHLIDYYNDKSLVALLEYQSAHEADCNDDDDVLSVLLVITHGSLISNYLNNYSNSLILENSSKRKNNGTLKNKYNNMKVLPSSFVFLQNCTTTEESVKDNSENDSWILEYSNINFQCFKKRLFLLHECNGNQQPKNLKFYNYAKIVEFQKFNLIPEKLYDVNNPYLIIEKNNATRTNVPYLDHDGNNNNNNNGDSNSEDNNNGLLTNLQTQASPHFEFSHYNTSSSSLDSYDNGMESSTPTRSRDRRNTVLTTTTSISHITTHEELSTLKKNTSPTKIFTNSAVLTSGDHISGYDFSQNFFKFDNINDIVDHTSDSSKLNQSLINFTYNNNSSSVSFDDQIVTSKKDSRNFENVSYLSKFSNKFTNLHLAANNSSSWSQLDIFGAPRVCILSSEGIWAKKNRHGKFILHVNGMESLKSHKDYCTKSQENVNFYFPDDNDSDYESQNTDVHSAEASKENSSISSEFSSVEKTINNNEKKSLHKCPPVDTSISNMHSKNDSIPKAFTPIARKFRDLMQQPDSSSNMLDNDLLNEKDDDTFNEIYGTNTISENTYTSNPYHSTNDLTSLAALPNANPNLKSDTGKNITASIDMIKYSDTLPNSHISLSSNPQRRNRFETISLPIMNNDNNVNFALKEIQNNFNFFKNLKKENSAIEDTDINNSVNDINNSNHQNKSNNFENTKNIAIEENMNKKKLYVSQLSEDISKSDSSILSPGSKDEYFVQKDNVFYFKQQKPASTNYRNKDHKLNEIILDEDNDGELSFAEDNDDNTEGNDRLVSSMKAFDERAAYFDSKQSNDFFASLNDSASNPMQPGNTQKDMKHIANSENATAVTKTQKTLFKKFEYMPAMTHPIPAAHGKKVTEPSSLVKKLSNPQLSNVQRRNSSSPKLVPDEDQSIKVFYGTAKLPSSTRYNDLVHNTSEENKIIFVSNSNETSRYNIY